MLLFLLLHPSWIPIFTSKIPPALPVIQADPVKLRQLLLNLLTNAKAAVLSPALKNPEQLPSIFLEARLAKQSLVIEIRDNGCGITSEQRDKIFEPFVTYKKDGTGLGLALARRIATSHGGTLTVSSVPGTFTVFTLSLPVQ